jgi:hypothetical protein
MLSIVALLSACAGSGDNGDVGVSPEAVTAVLSRGPDARSITLNHHALALNWGITKSQEEGCGGTAIAGGDLGGHAAFSQLGNSSVSVSAAWDIGHLITGSAHFKPQGPASGPVAPVLGQSKYPYNFHYDPANKKCGSGYVATGKVVLVAANGDQVKGDITGGETHKLDFIVDGDGVETFATVAVTGGTGRFSGATGSFVVHTIARLQPSLTFAVTFAELLPGATLGF